MLHIDEDKSQKLLTNQLLYKHL